MSKVASSTLNDDRPAYLVTRRTDTIGKIERLRTLGINIPNAFYCRIKQNKLIHEIAKAVPEYKIQPLDMSVVLRRNADYIHRVKCDRGALIVSTSEEIATTLQGMTLQISQIADPQTGDTIGYGPVPGHVNIEDQLTMIRLSMHKKSSRESSVLLVEDGALTGKTLAFIIKKMRQAKIPIAGVIVGFAFPEAITLLKGCLEGKIFVLQPTGNAVGWLPESCFLPALPGCGRLVGHTIFGEAYPFIDAKGRALNIPYIEPWGKLSEWANIPGNRAREVSKRCLELAVEIWKEIDRLNGRYIMTSELEKLVSPAHYPIRVGQEMLPPSCLDVSVTSMLSTVLKYELA